MIALLVSGCATVPRTPPGVAAAPPEIAAPAAVLSQRGCPPLADPRAVPAIRSEDAYLRKLLADGCQRSPTLWALADAIGKTDGVVYITTDACPIRALRGCLLHTIEDTGNARYLWIRMSPIGTPSTLLGTMAHELHHALEVLERPDLRSQNDLRDFYQSIASRSYSGVNLTSLYRSFETAAAVDAGNAVRAEMLSGSSAVATGGDRH